jgi:hypothetical protein
VYDSIYAFYRDKIEEIVKMSKVTCRRDYLWHRMAAATGHNCMKKGRPLEESQDSVRKIYCVTFNGVCSTFQAWESYAVCRIYDQPRLKMRRSRYPVQRTEKVYEIKRVRFIRT